MVINSHRTLISNQERWEEILALFNETKEIRISSKYLIKHVSDPFASIKLHFFVMPRGDIMFQ